MPSSPSPAPAVILVVDDEPLMLRIITQSLVGLGHTVHTAGDGVEALRIFQEKECNLVLTDYAMPHMNGDTLATAIKEISPRTPVIIMTGFRSPVASEAADHRLHKPFTSRELTQAVTDVLAASPDASSPGQ